MYLVFVALLVVCALYYDVKVRGSRVREVALQYPPCFRRMRLQKIGTFYRFITDSEEALKIFLKMGRGAMAAGGIARMYGFKHYLVMTDTTDVAEALSSYQQKDHMYRFVQVITGNGSIFVPDPSISKVRRQAILPAFTPKRLASYIQLMWADAAWLTDRLDRCAGQGPVCIEKYLSGFCCNVILSTMGVQEMKEEVSAIDLMGRFSRCFSLLYQRFISLWMHSDLLYSYSANYQEITRHVASFYEYADKAQEIRRNKLAQHSKSDTYMDFGLIDGMIGSRTLSRRDISEEMMIFVGAADEASVAMGFTLLLLAQYPAVQDRVYDELKAVIGDGDRLEKEQLARTPYLDLVVKEALRLYPPVPFVLRHADKEIKLSSGRIIPAGAGLIIPIISLHRNPKHWGPDAEHFDPERFLPARLAGVPDHAYMPFSHGPRSCPGYKFGSYIIKVGLCAILRRYRVVGAAAGPMGPIPEIRAKVEVVLKTVNHVQVALERRE